VSDGVGEEFGQDQRDRGALGRGERDRADGGAEADPPVGGQDVVGELPHQLVESEDARASRGHEEPVCGRQRGDPLRHGLKRGLGRRVRGAPRLQQDQGRDDLEVVLRPMVDLVQQRIEAAQLLGRPFGELDLG
jgi:hypothetical protein